MDAQINEANLYKLVPGSGERDPNTKRDIRQLITHVLIEHNVETIYPIVTLNISDTDDYVKEYVLEGCELDLSISIQPAASEKLWFDLDIEEYILDSRTIEGKGRGGGITRSGYSFVNRDVVTNLHIPVMFCSDQPTDLKTVLDDISTQIGDLGFGDVSFYFDKDLLHNVTFNDGFVLPPVEFIYALRYLNEKYGFYLGPTIFASMLYMENTFFMFPAGNSYNTVLNNVGEYQGKPVEIWFDKPQKEALQIEDRVIFIQEASTSTPVVRITDKAWQLLRRLPPMLKQIFLNYSRPDQNYVGVNEETLSNLVDDIMKGISDSVWNSCSDAFIEPMLDKIDTLYDRWIYVGSPYILMQKLYLSLLVTADVPIVPGNELSTHVTSMFVPGVNAILQMSDPDYLPYFTQDCWIYGLRIEMTKNRPDKFDAYMTMTIATPGFFE